MSLARRQVDLGGQVDLFCYEEELSSSQSRSYSHVPLIEQLLDSSPSTPTLFRSKSSLDYSRVLSNNHWHAKRLSGVYSVERTPKRRRRLDFSNLQKKTEDGVGDKEKSLEPRGGHTSLDVSKDSCSDQLPPTLTSSDMENKENASHREETPNDKEVTLRTDTEKTAKKRIKGS